MKLFIILGVLTAVSHGLWSHTQKRFPPDFLFGCSSASYQIEGAWNEDGKGENIWDHLIHNKPEVVEDFSNGDIACDSYHNYKRDVEMLRELGVEMYRFSLSWTRILPTGFDNVINYAGVKYYSDLINELLKYNIIPMVTLYHWDLPQKLQDLGGFANPLFGIWFEDYARVAFRYFGDRIKHWITFNEPNAICTGGYGEDLFSPMINSTAFGTYLCAKNLVLAHANAYHVYNNHFKPTQEGVCGITINYNWAQPLTDSIEDKFAAELRNQGQWALYIEPLFSVHGGFPKELSERIAKKSFKQGYSRSRLPELTEEEKIWTRGAVDFLGLNHYTAYLVTTKETQSSTEPSFEDDVGVDIYKSSDWLQSASVWLAKAPRSTFNVLLELKRRYNNPLIYITENGWPTAPDSGLIDDDRVSYYRASLEDVLDAIECGVNVKAFMAWSLMDNFEWTTGYKARFGLYQVDFEDPARTRTPRKSAFVYKHIIKNRYIDHNYEPKTLNMTIDNKISAKSPSWQSSSPLLDYNYYFK